jgi:hypothetical protein
MSTDNDESTHMKDTHTAKAAQPWPGYPPRYPSVQYSPPDLESGVAGRDAERFAIYAEELLAGAAGVGEAPENNPHALAIATLALVYEVKALRLGLLEGGGLTALADGISNLQDTLAEHGKYTAGEIRGLADQAGAAAHELYEMNRQGRIERGEDS